mgnify:CR=1 FL=1
MNINKSPLTDTVLSNQGIASLIFADALERVAKLAQVTQPEALALLVAETKLHTKDIPKNTNNTFYQPIIEHSEQTYICSLFTA